MIDATRDRSVKRLREAIHGADRAAAMHVFANRGATVAQMAASGASAVRCVRAGGPQLEEPSTCTASAKLEAYALPPDWGAAVALAHNCDIVGILRFVWTREASGRLCCRISLATTGAEIEALNRTFGRRAIHALLGRIATSPSLAAA